MQEARTKKESPLHIDILNILNISVYMTHVRVEMVWVIYGLAQRGGSLTSLASHRRFHVVQQQLEWDFTALSIHNT